MAKNKKVKYNSWGSRTCSFCDKRFGTLKTLEIHLDSTHRPSPPAQSAGMTKAEAHSKGICIECKQPWIPKTHSNAGVAEYRISAVCEECFDEMFKEEENET